MPTLHTQLTSALVSLLRRIRINDDISLWSRLVQVQDVVPHTHTAGMPRVIYEEAGIMPPDSVEVKSMVLG